jgi:hypothetical protein
MPRFPHQLDPHLTTGFNLSGPGQTMLRDIIWDRPIFRAPALPNPRVIFDPLPFRTQLFGAFKGKRRTAK